VWEIVSPRDFRFDESKLNSIESAFSALTAEKVIEENASDLAQYGLDKPVTVSVKLDDDTVKALEIGDETPSKTAYYLKEKGSSKVYSVEKYYGDKLKVSRNDIRNKTLFTAKLEDINALSLERGGQQVFASKKVGENQWEMTSPIRGNLDTAVASTMLGALTQAAALEYVEANAADLEKYGLAKPAYAMEFATPAGKSKLLLGKENKRGEDIFARVDGSSEVFTLPLSSFTFLDKPLKEIVEVFAYLANINDVNKIVVDIDGQTVVSELQTNKDDSSKDKFTVNGKDVTALKDENGGELFRKYYQALIGITLDDIEVGAVPSEKPEITFTYYLNKAPQTMKIEFVPKNDKYYYVVRNGEYAGIIVAKSQFDSPQGVRASYKKLAEAMEKQN